MARTGLLLLGLSLSVGPRVPCTDAAQLLQGQPQQSEVDGRARAIKSNDHQAVSAGAVQRYEPGGWGAFLALKRHPSNPSVWVAGADVGGLFVSRDDSKSWAVCNAGLATRWIYQILFLADETPLLATTMGVYRGSLSKEAGPCLWEFALSNDGMAKANSTETMRSSRFDFKHPVRVLHVDTQLPSRVWAGVGISKNRGPASGRSGDRFHVYRSENSGDSWQGVLTLAGLYSKTHSDLSCLN
jgi:hypothetical protein